MSDTNRTTWDFLADTYWYVTTPDLPALQFSADDDLLAWKCDQTVWHISGYKNGYFWGVSSALVLTPDESGTKRAETPQQRSMVGTVTADGRVQITFVSSGRRNESIITGFGSMTKIGERWVFQMQMTTGFGDSQTLHWANMMQTQEGDASWENLPGVNCSVPAMLEGASYPKFDAE
ncbi:MAG TPA: hypothetical protein VEC06_14800 [Paucimonas sp.]|nr:hypothetical protein [Paucimonas sp.]